MEFVLDKVHSMFVSRGTEFCNWQKMYLAHFRRETRDFVFFLKTVVF